MCFSIKIYFVLECEVTNGLEKLLKLGLFENYIIFKSIYIVVLEKKYLINKLIPTFCLGKILMINILTIIIIIILLQIYSYI